MAGALERAHGHWPEILTQLGVAPQFLRNRKGPCPACGGRDRFCFDDRGEGWYYCNQCGPGTGVVLLRKLHKWDHKTACEEIERVLGAAKPQPTAVSTRAPRSDKARAADLDRLLGEATDPSVVARFLASRSLAVSSPVLRNCSACRPGQPVPTTALQRSCRRPASISAACTSSVTTTEALPARPPPTV